MPFAFWLLGNSLPSSWGIFAIWLWFLSITLPSFGDSLAIWLLISGHVFAVCLIWSVTSSWWSSGLVWFGEFGLVTLVWVCGHLVQTAWAKMASASSKVPHPTWESLGKKFLMTCQPIAMIQWQEKWPKNIKAILTQNRKMDWSSLLSRTFSDNQ